MKVQRDDPAAVRAGKWAERWNEEADRTLLVAMVEEAAPSQRLFPPVALRARSQACRTRALLWRREVARRSALRHAACALYFGDDSDYQTSLWAVVHELDPRMADALYEGKAGRLLFPEEYNDE